jgi:hypothetical protein
MSQQRAVAETAKLQNKRDALDINFLDINYYNISLWSVFRLTRSASFVFVEAEAGAKTCQAAEGLRLRGPGYTVTDRSHYSFPFAESIPCKLLHG